MFLDWKITLHSYAQSSANIIKLNNKSRYIRVI